MATNFLKRVTLIAALSVGILSCQTTPKTPSQCKTWFEEQQKGGYLVVHVSPFSNHSLMFVLRGDKDVKYIAFVPPQDIDNMKNDVNWAGECLNTTGQLIKIWIDTDPLETPPA